jgi:hypothetical protein
MQFEPTTPGSDRRGLGARGASSGRWGRALRAFRRGLRRGGGRGALRASGGGEGVLRRGGGGGGAPRVPAGAGVGGVCSLARRAKVPSRARKIHGALLSARRGSKHPQPPLLRACSCSAADDTGWWIRAPSGRGGNATWFVYSGDRGGAAPPHPTPQTACDLSPGGEVISAPLRPGRGSRASPLGERQPPSAAAVRGRRSSSISDSVRRTPVEAVRCSWTAGAGAGSATTSRGLSWTAGAGSWGLRQRSPAVSPQSIAGAEGAQAWCAWSRGCVLPRRALRSAPWIFLARDGTFARPRGSTTPEPRPRRSVPERPHPAPSRRSTHRPHRSRPTDPRLHRPPPPTDPAPHAPPKREAPAPGGPGPALAASGC